jgi:Ca-activated chloride channel family protein
MEFRDPELLYLLAAIPAVALLWRLFAARPRALRLPILTTTAAGPTVRTRLRWLVPALYLAALALFVVALARPRSGEALSVIPAEGIDIALVLDLSSSMEEFLEPDRTRIDAAKQVIVDFVGGLENDRVGLVIFQEDALPLSPPTLDYDAVANLVTDLESGLLPDGTAIGLGIAEAVSMLEESRARSRVIVLLTDGRNNQFTVRPAEAAALAESLGIRVYTIGLSEARVSGGNLDAELMTEIAETTGGRFFRVTDEESLGEVYDEIGRLEKSRVGGEEFTVFDEYGPRLALLGVLLLAGGVVLSQTAFRRSP